MAKVWKASEASIKMALASNITITSATALHTLFTSGSSSSLDVDMKGIEITAPEMSVEKIDLVGQDTNGIQNAEIEEKPAGLAKLTSTLILRGDEGALETYGFESSTTVTGGYTRYQRKNASRKKVSVLVNLDDGTDAVNILLHDCFITTMSPKLTGADGHFEIEFAVETKATNYYEEFKN